MAQKKKEIGSSRSLVLDANILLRAVLGRRVRSIVERYRTEIPFFIPTACVAEVLEYLPGLCAKRNWQPGPSLHLLETLLETMNIVEESFYVDLKDHAMRRIGERDPDDWHVVALALSLGAAVWTEDTDFFGAGIATWNTSTVEIFLSDDPWQVNDVSMGTGFRAWTSTCRPEQTPYRFESVHRYA